MDVIKEVLKLLKPKFKLLVLPESYNCSEGKSEAEGDMNLEGFTPYTEMITEEGFPIMRTVYSQHICT